MEASRHFEVGPHLPEGEKVFPLILETSTNYLPSREPDTGDIAGEVVDTAGVDPETYGQPTTSRE